MCGRFMLAGIDDIDIAETAIKELIDEETTKLEGEAYPTDIVPVICKNKKDELCIFSMKWGYSAMGKCIFNAKSETALEKPMFEDGMKNRRCIIPSSNYFEWGKVNKIKYAIKPKEANMTYLAGIYRFEENNKPVFTILTKDASDFVKEIHHRMPVIFNEEDALAWLDRKKEPLEIIGKSLDEMTFYKAD